MRDYQTFDEMEEEYFVRHPDEIDDYIGIIFEEYTNDGDVGALLASLRRVVRYKGVSETSRETGISRNGIQKALSRDGSPKFESVAAILKAIGYCLVPQKIAT